MFPIEAFRSTLEKVVDVFEKHDVRYHLTGSITSVAYGEPRLTQDVDVVISPDDAAQHAEELLAAIQAAGFLTDPESTRAALQDGRMFQLLDEVELLKIDVYPRELIPGELSRSITMSILPDLEVPVCSLPDSAASKLVWVDRGSHKGRRDVRRIYAHATVEQQRQIEELAAELSLGQLLSTVLNEPDELPD